MVRSRRPYFEDRNTPACVTYRGLGMPQAPQQKINRNDFAHVGSRGFIVLNIGWYRREPKRLVRTDGHWVTVVEHRGTHRLWIHDPGGPEDSPPQAQHLALVPLGEAIELAGRRQAAPIPARGILRVADGLSAPRNADAALLDGVVRLGRHAGKAVPAAASLTSRGP